MPNIKRANTSGITKSGVAISDVPDAPTIGAVTDSGDGTTATVAYTAATRGGAATTFTATSSPGSFTGTGSSPISVTGLTAGTAYTFTVVASNSTGSSPASAASSSLTLVVPGAWESIATSTLSSTQTSITFSSIPATYKDLQLRILNRVTSVGGSVYNMWLTFNGSTSGSGDSHHVRGGATVQSYNNLNNNYVYLESVCPDNATNSGHYGPVIIDMVDYANTSKHKSLNYIGGVALTGTQYSSGGFVVIGSGNWRNTAAINSIVINTNAAGFAANSTFALYGLKG